ncbi:DUF1684 domain-containing protein [Winogradskyella immobilis]|uniref:DUF1684 domain-containing protein n=1 Tax=Winogradskyella immobilis TaxID=2816852 RepID=A0ABS8ENP9_9FLAO|nr:DUF1684 domain-containing protein [Winogradskyella immobilis]MCC1484492.1 DUF1684 domain-containing protein [Winogradskyella immobilis]MCG0016584.1 DUF1684 domain-containing protein [Winogradskyella immobilis]
MQRIALLALMCLQLSCSQNKRIVQGETEWQRKMNAEFKDASKSPLKNKDLKTFEGLDFFKFDSAYVVTAKLIRTPDAQPFKMKTTTSRLANYRQYGIMTFEMNGAAHELKIYQNIDILDDPEYVDYLFIPYLDDTNGDTSYGGGRYVEGRIPEGDTIIIDFNTTYNPYCVYNEGFSCPIVPRENYLATKVEAGMKNYKKH